MQVIVAAWRDGVSLWTIFWDTPTSLATSGFSLLAGLALLSMAIYFTPSSEAPLSTYDPTGKPPTARKRFGYDHTPFTYIRNAILGITSTIFFLDIVLARHSSSMVHFEAGEATVGMYGIFRVWETCFAGIIDGVGLPYWECLPRSGVGAERPGQDASGTRLKDGSTSSHRQDRAKYTFDLLTSVRGVSWIKDCKFSILSPRTERERSEPPIPPSVFLRQKFIYLVLCLVLVDIFDTLNKSRHWTGAEDVVSAILAGSSRREVARLEILYRHPITSLPWYQQPPFVLSVCALTQLALELFYTPIAIFCVGLSHLFPSVLLNINSNAFLPLFHDPISLHTRTVAGFWSAWHHIFKNSFQRLVDPLLYVFGTPNSPKYARRVLKFVLTFAFSAILHIIVIHRTQRFSLRPYSELGGHDPVLLNRIRDAIWTSPWADHDIILFFISQAFAILFERSLILPFVSWSNWRIHPRSSVVLLRLWTYCWLFYSGRWWSDVWVRCGFWAPHERVVLISIVRGIWKGDWLGKG